MSEGMSDSLARASVRISDSLARALDLTDALLATTRNGRPDLALVESLLRERGAILESLAPPAPDERVRRLAALQRIQATDAEVRAYFAERHAVTRDALRALALHGPPRAAPRPRSRLVDGQA